MLFKQDRKPILAFIPSYKAERIIKGQTYTAVSYKKDKFSGGENWNIYKFADLLDLEDKVWLEQDGENQKGILDTINPLKRGSY